MARAEDLSKDDLVGEMEAAEVKMPRLRIGAGCDMSQDSRDSGPHARGPGRGCDGGGGGNVGEVDSNGDELR